MANSDEIYSKIIKTPTLRDLEFAKSMLEITGVSMVGYGSHDTAKEAGEILNQLAATTNITIGNLPDNQNISLGTFNGIEEVKIDESAELTAPLNAGIPRNDRTPGIS